MQNKYRNYNMRTTILTLFATLSAFGGEQWFDAGIKSYADWPANDAELVIESVGKWTNTASGLLVGEDGARRIAVRDESERPLVWTTTKPRPENSPEIVSFWTTVDLPGAYEELPAPPQDVKFSLTAAAVGNAVAFFGLAKDPVGGTNVWTQLKGDAFSLVDSVNVAIDAKDVNGAHFVRITVGTTRLADLNDNEWIEVAYPDEEPIASVLYSGAVTISTVAGPAVVEDTTYPELLSLEPGSYRFTNVNFQGGLELAAGGDYTLYFEGTNSAAYIARQGANVTFAGPGALDVQGLAPGVKELRISEIMPKPTDAQKRGTLEGMDPNGLESGWVEIENLMDYEVDLANYRFIRVNRSKKCDTAGYGNFPSWKIPAHGRTIFYTSERYANSADMSVSAFATPVNAEKPMIYTAKTGEKMLIWPDKVNPKKFPFVRLYYAPNGEVKDVIDTVVIPSDLPEGASIIVGETEDGKATKRWICEAPTRNAPNPSTTGLVALGPNVGPLYEIKDGKKHDSASEFALPVAPASPTNDYEIVFAANPVMSPDGSLTPRDEDAFTKIELVYRKDLGSTKTVAVDLKTLVTDAKDWGDKYTVKIPKADLPNPGHLIQWKFRLTDKAGNVWTSPSYHNKDDGYEWYGTIVEPTAAQMAAGGIPTWHMFVDDASKSQMNVDADKQDRSKVPNQARVAIYDSSTSNYYDYVRIDLRGHTSANFTKKGHGLRFAKAHPLTMDDPVSGGKIKEIRKTSLISEHADPSYVRQMLGFWLWRKMGNKTPFDFPVYCNLNGEFFQVAFNSERFTDELIEDVYGFDKFGYSYKNVGTLVSDGGTTAGGIEKKTPDDEDESNITVLQNELRKPMRDYGVDNVSGTSKDALSSSTTDSTGLDNAKLTKFVVEKFDLAAWINYLASARITQEMDDVWANICMYYDNPAMIEGARGTGTWMPLGYDFNVSFGQYYKDANVSVSGLMCNQDWFKSHPFYGGNRVRCWNSSMSGQINSGNRGFEAVWQSAKFRRLYLRRLRTLMDQELGAPNADETYENSTTPFVVKMREMVKMMGADANKDRQKWPWDKSFGAIDAWGNSFPTTMEAGVRDLYENYIVPRRVHLFETHSIHNDNMVTGYGTNLKAGIPDTQSAIDDLKDGFSAEIVSGGVVIRNANDEAIDLSGWKVSGPVSMTLPAGTVIDRQLGDKNGEIFVVTDRRAYVAANTKTLTDEVIIGNAEAGDAANPIGLTSPDGINVFAIEKSEQELYLRLWGFAGAPDGESTDANEFIVFTNLNQEASLDASGAHIQFEKTGEVKNRCNFILPEGTIISAGGWVRFNQADVPWEKITDGFQDITMSAANGVVIEQYINLDQATIIGNKGSGKMAVHNLETDAWYAILITEAPGYVAPPMPPEPPAVPTRWEETNVIEKVTLVPGEYEFANVSFAGGLELMAGVYKIKNDGAKSVNSAAFVSAEGASVAFTGKGRFELNGENVTNSLFTAKDLIVSNGVFAIDFTSETNKVAAVSLTGNFAIADKGKVEMTLGGNQPYGIELTNKTMTADFTDTSAVVATLGGTKASAFKFKGSDIVTFAGGTMEVEITGTGAKVIDGGTLTFEDGYQLFVQGTGAATNALVFAAGKTLTFNGGQFVIVVPGAGSTLFASDDLALEEALQLNGGAMIAVTGAGTEADVAAADFSGKFVGITGAVNGDASHVWAKLPELTVDEVSVFVFTPGIDPTKAPSVSDTAPSEEFATGFHDLYLDIPQTGVLAITKVCARCQPLVPAAKDLGWIELKNVGEYPLELSNYQVYCVNRGKKLKQEEAFTLPVGTLEVGASFRVWTSESPVEALPDTATPLYAKKINQKKYPMIQLYKGGVAMQTVLVPVDLADETVYDAAADRRPTISPLYGVKDAPDPWQAFAQAKIGEDYSVTLPLLPADMSAADEDQIAKAKLIYRIGFGPVQTNATAMTKSAAKDKMNGWTYTGTIPGTALTKAGELVRFAVAITDNAGRTFRAPSFQNLDDGYEWYGTVVEPAEGMTDAKVQTFYLFADNASLSEMDKDVDSQNKSVVPYNARVGIYDALTGLYYDNVRIDLRGNTTARFPKKSHGLRFSKAQPLSCTDPVTGTVFEEIRKTSFVADYMDPAYIRQSLSFWLFREAGAKAPYDYPVKLNLNGEFYQLAWNSNRFTDELIEDVYGLDPLGYAFKNCGTIQPGHHSSITTEKKTPDDEEELNIEVEKAFENTLPDRANYETKTDDGENNATYNAVVVRTFDLPAWLNYMAMTRITSETDDTWSNISLYYDINGTGTWMPLAYDCHLSFGAFFCHDAKEGVRADADYFKSHPFYGGWRVPAHYKGTEEGGWGGAHMGMGGGSASNSGLESIYQSPKFRRLYLRRLRTLMDEILEAPGTAREDSKLWGYIATITNATAKLAAADRAKWPLSGIYNFQNDSMNCWPNVASMTPAMGIEDLWNNYVVPRRVHLFETHSVHNTEKGVGYNNRLSAGIPDKQSAIATLRAGITAEYDQTLCAVVIRNRNKETIDVSGWTLTGPVEMALPAGTILDQQLDETSGELYVTVDRKVTVAAMTVTDQVVVGNGKAGKSDAKITLTAADGTKVFELVPAVDPVEGTITAGEEEGTWVVTPAVGANEVTVANLPDDGILVVPSVIEKVTGVLDGQIRVVNRDEKSGRSFDVTAAFTIRGGTIELNRDAAVGGVKVTPEIKVVAETIEEPFTLGDNGGEVTVQTIPGLTYLLVRGTDVRAIDDVRASKMATDLTLTLVDELKPDEKTKPSCAFYVIRVTR